VRLSSFWGNRAQSDGLQPAVDAVNRPGAEFLALSVIAVVVEGIVEYLVAPFFDRWKEGGADPVLIGQALRWVTAVLGIVIAWQLDLAFFRLAFEKVSLSPWFDIAVTGIVIGRGSNYLNEFVGNLSHNF
jgi:hypothetical protein